MSQDAVEIALREVKRVARLQSALDDAKSGVAPAKSGLKHDPKSDEVRNLTTQINEAMKAAGLDTSDASPEERWKTAKEGVQTRLVNAITDLSKQIDTGVKSPKKVGIEYDQETTELAKFRDGLREIVQSIEGKPEMSDEQKIRVATSAVEKSIAEYERRIKENDLTPAQKKASAPETPELIKLREHRDELKNIFKDMQETAKGPKDPEAGRKARLLKRKEELERQIATGEFGKPSKEALPYTQESWDMRSENILLKRQTEQIIERRRLENLSGVEKFGDLLKKIRRFTLLSGLPIFGKLGAAAASRFVLTPTEAMIGSITGHIPGYSKIMEQSARHGTGFNFSHEAEEIGRAHV
jgi:hypothetical protein